MNVGEFRTRFNLSSSTAGLRLVFLIMLATMPATGAAGPAISAGSNHTIALKSDGSVWAWGFSIYGEIGDGSTTAVFRPMPVQVSGLSGVAAVSAGTFLSIALRGDGTVWTWGRNDHGQLGDGTTTNRSTPVQVSGLTGVTAISAGYTHAVALKGDGSVWAWGQNNGGQLGDGTTIDRLTPVRANGLTGFTSIIATTVETLALKGDGTVWKCCNLLAVPSQEFGFTDVVAISALTSHRIALKSDGSVWGLGGNAYGELGNNPISFTAQPVNGLTGVVALSAGDRLTTTLKNDGNVWALGLNSSGQLGDGTTTNSAIPVQVSGMSGVVAISSGWYHTVALKGDGSVWEWGYGYGVSSNRLTPVPISINLGTSSATSTTTPIFPMVVTGTITPTVANITAAIQYRPQDVGTTGSVYVFALAPANLVQSVSTEAVRNHKGPVARSTNTADSPLACVLAQLNSTGQLAAVSASTLQAYLTGVLGSQGATVSVLNNVSTAVVQGAVFYVGYGTSSTSMINNGINRSAVTVPGTSVCQPQAPQTGWWWNPAEDGRGFGIEVRGNNLFMSGYLYDDSGHATWVVSPGPVSLDGSLFNSTMYQVANGQTLTGNYKSPSPPTVAGPITLSFTDARNGTLIWPGGSIPLVRFDTIIGSGNGATPSFVPENGWWWNESESGRGFFLEIKNNFMFVAGYMYEADGRPVWYVAQNPMSTPQTFSSTWLQVAGGQTLTGPYKKPTILNSNVGPVNIQFTDATNAMLTLPGGRQVAITRHRF